MQFFGKQEEEDEEEEGEEMEDLSCIKSLLDSVLKSAVKEFDFKQILREQEQAKRAKMLLELQQKFPRFNK